MATAAKQILEARPDVADVVMAGDITMHEEFRERVTMRWIFDALVADLQLPDDGALIAIRPEQLLPHGQARRAEYVAAGMEPRADGPVWWRPSIV